MAFTLFMFFINFGFEWVDLVELDSKRESERERVEMDSRKERVESGITETDFCFLLCYC